MAMGPEKIGETKSFNSFNTGQLENSFLKKVNWIFPQVYLSTIRQILILKGRVEQFQAFDLWCPPTSILRIGSDFIGAPSQKLSPLWIVRQSNVKSHIFSIIVLRKCDSPSKWYQLLTSGSRKCYRTIIWTFVTPLLKSFYFVKFPFRIQIPCQLSKQSLLWTEFFILVTILKQQLQAFYIVSCKISSFSNFASQLSHCARN